MVCFSLFKVALSQSEVEVGGQGEKGGDKGSYAIQKFVDKTFLMSSSL